MKIRIRNDDGSVTDVPAGKFVEIVTPEGKVALASSIQETTLLHITRDEGGRDYQALFPDVEFTDD